MNPTERSLSDALWHGRPTAFMALWRQAGSPHAPVSSSSVGGRHPTTWLDLAIHQGCVGAVKGLIRAGVPLKNPTEAPSSVLWAVLYAHSPKEFLFSRYRPPVQRAARLASIARLLIQAGVDPRGHVLGSKTGHGADFLTLCLDDRHLPLVEALERIEGPQFFRRSEFGGFAKAVEDAIRHQSPQVLDRALTWLRQDAPGELPACLAQSAHTLSGLWPNAECMRVLARHGHDWSGPVVNPDPRLKLEEPVWPLLGLIERAQRSLQNPGRNALFGIPEEEPVAKWLPPVRALFDLGADDRWGDAERVAFVTQAFCLAADPKLAPLGHALLEEAIQRGWRLKDVQVVDLGQLHQAATNVPELALRTLPTLGISLTQEFQGDTSRSRHTPLLGGQDGEAEKTGTWGGVLWAALAALQAPTPELIALLTGLGVGPHDHWARHGAPLIHHVLVHPDWGRWLLAQGADIEARDARGLTALLHAARKGHADHMAWLVQAGADTGAEAEGRGLVGCAVQSDSMAALRQALTLCPPRPGQPLWHEVLSLSPRRNTTAIVDALEEAGADWTAVDAQGRRPLEIWLGPGEWATRLPHRSPGLASALCLEDPQGDWPAEAAFRQLCQRLHDPQKNQGATSHLTGLLSQGARLRRSRFPADPLEETLLQMVGKAVLNPTVVGLFRTAACTQDLEDALPSPSARPRVRL